MEDLSLIKTLQLNLILELKKKKKNHINLILQHWKKNKWKV